MKYIISVFIFVITLPLIVQASEDRGRGLQLVKIQDQAGQEVGLYENSHALIIGVSDYTAGWPNLPGVKEDVLAVRQALEKNGFQVDVVENPNYIQLDQAIRNFINRHGEHSENRLLFYFAGHGHTEKLATNVEMGYIVPADAPNPHRDASGFRAKAMDMQMFESYAKRIQAKHTLFLFDSCFSGSIFDLSRAVPGNITYKTTKPVRQFITSGSAGEEVPDKSIFRQQFVAALNGEGDSTGDGYVTGAELGEFLQTAVVNYSKGTQHPQYGKIRDPRLDKGDFVFVLPGAAYVENIRVTPDTPPQAVDPEAEMWELVKQSTEPADIQAFLDAFPEGRLAKVARFKLMQLQRKQPQKEKQKAPAEVKKDVVKKERTTTRVKESSQPEPVRSAAAEPGLRLRAILREGVAPLQEDVFWWVYAAKKDAKGKRKEVTRSGAAIPLFKLPAGHYYITVRYGDAWAAREVEIAAAELTELTVNLNAGHGRFQAVLTEGAEPLQEDVFWWVYAVKKDVEGKRKEITRSGAAIPLFRLTAGRYYVTVRHGDAWAAQEVEIPAGELTELTVVLNAGNVRFYAVPVEGAEPLQEEVFWWVYATKKDLKGRRKEITRSGAAIPLFRLTAGRYYVTVRHGDAWASQEVEIPAGELTEVLMVLNAGYLRFRAALIEGADPLQEEVFWWVYAAKKDIKGKRKEITRSGAAIPLFKLPAGRYYVTVRHGDAWAAQEVELPAGELTEITMILNAGNVRFRAALIEGAEPLQEEVFWWVYGAKKDLKGNRKEITRSGAAIPLFRLSAGRYYVTVRHGDAWASQEVEITAGDLTEITMILNAGNVRFYAVSEEGAEPLQKGVFWWVYEAQKDLKGNRKEITRSGAAIPLFRLSAGRYYVTVRYGDIWASREIEIPAGELIEVTLDVSK